MSQTPSLPVSAPETRVTLGLVCSIGVGGERGGRLRNEDNYLVCRGGQARFRDGDHEEVKSVCGQGILLAVADGMGGHAEGEIASSAAVQALARLYARGRPEIPEMDLLRFVLEAHQHIRARVSERGKVNLGTTLTTAWILDDRLYWVHVGDSRLYLFREGRLSRLTTDQTRKEFALRDHRPVSRDGDLLAQNFIYGSRGLGNDQGIRIDAGRDTGSRRLFPGDRLLFCTDGLTSEVDDLRIADALREVPTPAACAEVLLERAIAQGSTDNLTILIARVDSVPPAGDGSSP